MARREEKLLNPSIEDSLCERRQKEKNKNNNTDCTVVPHGEKMILRM